MGPKKASDELKSTEKPKISKGHKQKGAGTVIVGKLNSFVLCTLYIVHVYIDKLFKELNL